MYTGGENAQRGRVGEAYGKWLTLAYLCLAAVGPGVGFAVVWMLR
jgi:hypothetical protein